MKIERNYCLTWTAVAVGALAFAGCSGQTTAANSPDDTAEYEALPAEDSTGTGTSEEPFAPDSSEGQYDTQDQQPGQPQQNPGTDPGMQEDPQNPGTQPGSPGSPGTQPGSPGSPGTEGAPDTEGIAPGTEPRDPSGVDDPTQRPGAGTQPGSQGSTAPNQGSRIDEDSPAP